MISPEAYVEKISRDEWKEGRSLKRRNKSRSKSRKSKYDDKYWSEDPTPRSSKKRQKDRKYSSSRSLDYENDRKRRKGRKSSSKGRNYDSGEDSFKEYDSYKDYMRNYAKHREDRNWKGKKSRGKRSVGSGNDWTDSNHHNYDSTDTNHYDTTDGHNHYDSTDSNHYDSSDRSSNHHHYPPVVVFDDTEREGRLTLEEEEDYNKRFLRKLTESSNKKKEVKRYGELSTEHYVRYRQRKEERRNEIQNGFESEGKESQFESDGKERNEFEVNFANKMRKKYGNLKTKKRKSSGDYGKYYGQNFNARAWQRGKPGKSKRRRYNNGKRGRSSKSWGRGRQYSDVPKKLRIVNVFDHVRGRSYQTPGWRRRRRRRQVISAAPKKKSHEIDITHKRLANFSLFDPSIIAPWGKGSRSHSSRHYSHHHGSHHGGYPGEKNHHSRHYSHVSDQHIGLRPDHKSAPSDHDHHSDHRDHNSGHRDHHSGHNSGYHDHHSSHHDHHHSGHHSGYHSKHASGHSHNSAKTHSRRHSSSYSGEEGSSSFNFFYPFDSRQSHSAEGGYHSSRGSSKGSGSWEEDKDEDFAEKEKIAVPKGNPDDYVKIDLTKMNKRHDHRDKYHNHDDKYRNHHSHPSYDSSHNSHDRRHSAGHDSGYGSPKYHSGSSEKNPRRRPISRKQFYGQNDGVIRELKDGPTDRSFSDSPKYKSADNSRPFDNYEYDDDKSNNHMSAKKRRQKQKRRPNRQDRRGKRGRRRKGGRGRKEGGERRGGGEKRNKKHARNPYGRNTSKHMHVRGKKTVVDHGTSRHKTHSTKYYNNNNNHGSLRNYRVRERLAMPTTPKPYFTTGMGRGMNKYQLPTTQRPYFSTGIGMQRYQLPTTQRPFSSKEQGYGMQRDEPGKEGYWSAIALPGALPVAKKNVTEKFAKLIMSAKKQLGSLRQILGNNDDDVYYEDDDYDVDLSGSIEGTTDGWYSEEVDDNGNSGQYSGDDLFYDDYDFEPLTRTDGPTNQISRNKSGQKFDNYEKSSKEDLLGSLNELLAKEKAKTRGGYQDFDDDDSEEEYQTNSIESYANQRHNRQKTSANQHHYGHKTHGKRHYSRPQSSSEEYVNPYENYPQYPLHAFNTKNYYPSQSSEESEEIVEASQKHFMKRE